MALKTEGMLLEKQYTIPFALFRAAFTAFQKRFVYPKSRIAIAVLLLVCCIYGYFFLFGDDGKNAIYGTVIIVCLALAVFQWYNPRKIRRNLMEAVREIEHDEYRLRIFPEYLEIGTLLPEEEEHPSDELFNDEPEENFSGTRIYYNKGLHVTEYADFLMIYQQKTMFYVVPKAAFTEEELEILRVHFSQQLGSTYQSKV